MDDRERLERARRDFKRAEYEAARPALASGAVTGGLDVERLHRALWAIGEPQLRYVIDEGKYIEAASLIAAEYARLSVATDRPGDWE